MRWMDRRIFTASVGGVAMLLSAAVMATEPTAKEGTAKVPGKATVAPAMQAAFEVQTLRDEVYAQVDDQPLSCDVYLPRTVTDRPRPAVVLIHGGGWRTGNKWTMQVHGNEIAKRGIVAIAINYRLAPESKFPAQLDDCRRALRWTVDQKERLKIDPEALGVFGYSAGGHLACLLATMADEDLTTRAAASLLDKDDRLLREPVCPRAIVAGGSVCDFTDLPPQVRLFEYFLGGSRQELPDVYRLASPVAMASAGDLPIFLYHGAADMMVPPAQSQSLWQRHQQLGVATQLQEVPRLGHLLTFMDPNLRTTVADYFHQSLFVDTNAVKEAAP